MIEFLIPILFLGTIILVGIIWYRFYKRKHDTKGLFEFKGWRKFIYYIGWLNIFNLIFWIVLISYYRRYKHFPRKERHKKLAYVVYYFGYVFLLILFILTFINLFF